MKRLAGFSDLSKLPEDDRIQVIGNFCIKHPGKMIAVPTDNEPDKPERYKRKLEAAFPNLTVVIAARSGPLAILHCTYDLPSTN